MPKGPKFARRRYIELLPNNGYAIIWPDGKEIALMQDNEEAFYDYAFDTALDLNLQPPSPDSMRAHLRFRPVIMIELSW